MPQVYTDFCVYCKDSTPQTVHDFYDRTEYRCSKCGKVADCDWKDDEEPMCGKTLNRPRRCA